MISKAERFVEQLIYFVQDRFKDVEADSPAGEQGRRWSKGQVMIGDESTRYEFSIRECKTCDKRVNAMSHEG